VRVRAARSRSESISWELPERRVRSKRSHPLDKKSSHCFEYNHAMNEQYTLAEIQRMPMERLLLNSKKRCEQLAENQRDIERNTYGTQEFIYGAYLGGVHSYFSDMPTRQAQSFHELADPRLIRADKEAREARGEQPALGDWFGPGFIGYDLGFKRIFSADLIAHDSAAPTDSETADLGPDKPLHTHFSTHSMIDISYQQRVFTQVRIAKQQEGLTLQTCFLRPFAGLLPYVDEPYAYVSIAHLLAGTYNALDSGGEMFVELTYLDARFLETWERLIREAGINIERKPDTHVFKITKASADSSMPDLQSLIASHPEFAAFFEEFSRNLLEKKVVS